MKAHEAAIKHIKATQLQRVVRGWLIRNKVGRLRSSGIRLASILESHWRDLEWRRHEFRNQVRADAHYKSVRIVYSSTYILAGCLRFLARSYGSPDQNEPVLMYVCALQRLRRKVFREFHRGTKLSRLERNMPSILECNQMARNLYHRTLMRKASAVLFGLARRRRKLRQRAINFWSQNFFPKILIVWRQKVAARKR